MKLFIIKIDALDELTKFIGPPLKDSFIDYYNFSEEEAVKAIGFYRERFKIKGLYENIVYESIEEVFEVLKEANKKLIIATSKPTVFAIEILKYYKLDKYFDFIAGSNLDGTRSRKAEVIKYALEECDVKDYSKVIMIGDRMHDIIGANEIGIDSIGVLYGYGSLEELEKVKPNYIIKEVWEVTNIILDGILEEVV